MTNHKTKKQNNPTTNPKKQLQTLIKTLKQKHPLKKVIIQFHPPHKLQCQADVEQYHWGYLIRINNTLTSIEIQYALCEEWAHARVWNKINTNKLFATNLTETQLSHKIHCPTWAIEYAKIINTRTTHLQTR